MPVTVKSEFTLIDFGAEQMPVRKHHDDAGMDIYAPYTFIVEPQCMVDVKLGFGTVLPFGYKAAIKPRGSSGKMGLLPIDNPIDSGYRGEIHAVVWNISKAPITIKKGERFCQLEIVPCVCCDMPIIKPDEAPSSERGTGCYGSTGGYDVSESTR